MLHIESMEMTVRGTKPRSAVRSHWIRISRNRKSDACAFNHFADWWMWMVSCLHLHPTAIKKSISDQIFNLTWNGIPFYCSALSGVHQIQLCENFNDTERRRVCLSAANVYDWLHQQFENAVLGAWEWRKIADGVSSSSFLFILIWLVCSVCYGSQPIGRARDGVPK